MNEECAWRLFGICVEYANGEAHSDRCNYTIFLSLIALVFSDFCKFFATIQSGAQV